MKPEWFNILKSIDWPTDILVLDFETYSDSTYSLSKLSTIEYIMDSRYEEHGVATFDIPGKAPFIEPQTVFWPEIKRHLHWLQSQHGQQFERCTVVCLNARFDISVLAFRYGIIPPYVVDILDLANYLDSRTKNSLAALCQRYKLPPKGDSKQFEGLHWDAVTSTDADGVPIHIPGMTDEQQVALSEYSCNDAEREWDLFCLLLPKLTRPEVELPLARQTLGLFIKPCIKVDMGFGDDLAKQMEAEVDKAVSKADITRKEASGNISFKSLMQEVLGDEPVPTKVGKKGPILALAKGDPGRERLLKHSTERVRYLMEARVAVKSWPLHIKRVGRIMSQAAANNGILPVPLKYYGGHTGRWAGTEKINLQNLTKRSEYEVINQVRNLLVAPSGFSLAIADAAQIEARMLAWLAGQSNLVEAFTAGKPIYCQFATEILGVPIRKVLPDDPPELIKYLKYSRTLGKVGVLGCGYGMGADTLQVKAKSQFGIEISASLAKKIVTHYRDSNRNITRFWQDIENAFKFVTRYPHETCDIARGLHFRREDDVTIIRLPCGRELRYPEAMVTGVGHEEHIKMPDHQKPGTYIYMWGGYLTENVIQAVSRDILGEAMLAFDTWGFPRRCKVGLHIHDEIIAVSPTDTVDKALVKLIEYLSVSPKWAPDAPLAAEGRAVERYG